MFSKWLRHVFPPKQPQWLSKAGSLWIQCYSVLTLLLLVPFSYKLMQHLKPFAIVVLNGEIIVQCWFRKWFWMVGQLIQNLVWIFPNGSTANTKPCLDTSKWWINGPSKTIWMDLNGTCTCSTAFYQHCSNGITMYVQNQWAFLKVEILNGFKWSISRRVKMSVNASVAEVYYLHEVYHYNLIHGIVLQEQWICVNCHSWRTCIVPQTDAQSLKKKQCSLGDSRKLLVRPTADGSSLK